MLDAPVVSAPDDAVTMGEYRADRDAAFGKPSLGFFDRSSEKLIVHAEPRTPNPAPQTFFVAVPPITKPVSLKSSHAAMSGPLGVSVITMVTGPEKAVSGPE